MRPELQAAELDIDNSRINLQLSRNQLKATLDLVAGYQQFGLGGRRIVRDFSGGFTDSKIIRVVPGGFGDSLSDLFSGDFRGYLLRLELQPPICW